MKTYLLKSTVFTIAACVAIAWAQPGAQAPGATGEEAGQDTGCPEHRQTMQKLEQDMQLTPEQKTRLDSLRRAGEATRKDVAEKLKDVRRKMKEELAKEKPDGALLLQFATQTADLVEQQTKSRLNHLLEVKKILTKEQFDKMLSREWRERGECVPKEQKKARSRARSR